MFLLSRPQAQPIGIDVGSDGVKMLQLQPAADSSGGAGGLAAVAARCPLPGPASSRPEVLHQAVAAAVRRGLRQGMFRGGQAVAALPNDIVHVRNLRLQPIPEAELEWAVRAEARDLLPFDPDAASVQFIDAGEVGAGPAGGGGGGPRREVRREVIMF